MPDANAREAMAHVVSDALAPILGQSPGGPERGDYAMADSILATLPSLGFVRITCDREQLEKVAAALDNLRSDPLATTESRTYAVLSALNPNIDATHPSPGHVRIDPVGEDQVERALRHWRAKARMDAEPGTATAFRAGFQAALNTLPSQGEATND